MLIYKFLDGTVDVIGGFEVIDNEYRIYVVEGISDKAMKLLSEKFPLMDANAYQDIKILRNRELKYKLRKYETFGIKLKKV